jgi:hypothetical protein
LQRILQHAQQQQQQEEEVSLESDVDDKRCSTTATTTAAACARNEDKKEDSTNHASPGDDHHHHSNDTTTNSSSTTTSSIASDDLQVPYDEHLLSDDDDNDYLDETLFDYDEPSNEPLRPGDVITYTLPIFTAGDARGRRVTTVLSTDPHRHPVLVLQNGDVLPPDTRPSREFACGNSERCILTSTDTFVPLLPFAWRNGEGQESSMDCDERESEWMALSNAICKRLPRGNNKRDLRPWICFTGDDENNRNLQVVVLVLLRQWRIEMCLHRNQSEIVVWKLPAMGNPPRRNVPSSRKSRLAQMIPTIRRHPRHWTWRNHRCANNQ